MTKIQLWQNDRNCLCTDDSDYDDDSDYGQVTKIQLRQNDRSATGSVTRIGDSDR